MLAYPAKSPDAPFFVWIPGTQKDVDFIVKDSKRSPDTHGWAYAEFAYDAASDTFTPTRNNARCGAACHKIESERGFKCSEKCCNRVSPRS